MSRKSPHPEPGTTGLATHLDAMYLELLRRFYEQEDRARALVVAEQLEAELADRPDVARSIRGEEIRSLIAELRGDLPAAIRAREAEIRKILELHSMVRGTAGEAYVFRQYDDRDVSDRLDLLAILHAEAGDFRRAVEVLEESRAYCSAHGIAFDGDDLVEEYSAAEQVA